MPAPDPVNESHEDPVERLNRNLIELLNELRVSGTGIQVLLAFLLIVPFNSGYRHLDSFDKAIYFTALMCIAAAATCLIAPSIHHRILFRQHQRPFVIWLGSRLLILGMAMLAVGLTAILILIANLVYGTPAAIIVGACAFSVLSSVWFAIPLSRRWKVEADGLENAAAEERRHHDAAGSG